jgi:hypothetical protein
MRRALAIDEAAYGADHPRVAIRLNNLAQLLQAANRLAEAEPLMRRALVILKASLCPDHPSTQTVRGNLGTLLATRSSSGNGEAEVPAGSVPAEASAGARRGLLARLLGGR